MRIRTIIIIGVAVSAVSATIMAAEVVISTKWTDQAIARENAAEVIAETVFQRNLVLQDYLLHPGERPRTQWQHTSETLTRLIEAPELANPQWTTTLTAISENLKKANDLFPRLTRVVETEQSDDIPDEVSSATGQQLEVQLQTAVRENLSLASGLERQLTKQTIRQLLHARWLHIVAAGSLMMVLAGIWITLFREVFPPLKKLKNAILKFGAGDRLARASLHIDNEIGEAARAFDDTANALNAASETLAERGRQLEAANEELEAFSYSVSHDLRGPLRSMDGFSQALLEDFGDKLDEQGKDYLRRVRQGSKKMSKLIDDLLALSRVTRRDLKQEQINLSSIAQSMAIELRQMDPGREVEFNIAPDIYVNGDKDLLSIALQNLFDNSWKFTSKKQRATIEFNIAENNGTRTYFVRDDGAGFDMNYANKVFEPFTRLHGGTDFEGTGIGLATVQRIVHRHGGRIWAEGAVDKGATVYFTL
jgi:signal transduction histidine kinase